MQITFNPDPLPSWWLIVAQVLGIVVGLGAVWLNDRLRHGHTEDARREREQRVRTLFGRRVAEVERGLYYTQHGPAPGVVIVERPTKLLESAANRTRVLLQLEANEIDAILELLEGLDVEINFAKGVELTHFEQMRDVKRMGRLGEHGELLPGSVPTIVRMQDEWNAQFRDFFVRSCELATRTRELLGANRLDPDA